MELLSRDFARNTARFDALLGVGHCFDMIARDLVAGGRRCRLYTVDGYGDDAVIERIISFLLALPSTADAADMQGFLDRYVTFGEISAERDVDTAVTGVFLGKTALLVENFRGLIESGETGGTGADHIDGAHTGGLDGFGIVAEGAVFVNLDHNTAVSGIDDLGKLLNGLEGDTGAGAVGNELDAVIRGG